MQRFAALVHKDIPAIARGLVDEVVYVHATGRRQSKTDYLDGLSHSPMTFSSITVTDRIVKVWGDGGFTRATYTIVVGDRALPSSYLAIYLKRDGRWQLVSWQTTPSQPAAPRLHAARSQSRQITIGAQYPTAIGALSPIEYRKSLGFIAQKTSRSFHPPTL